MKINWYIEAYKCIYIYILLQEENRSILNLYMVQAIVLSYPFRESPFCVTFLWGYGAKSRNYGTLFKGVSDWDLAQCALYF